MKTILFITIMSIMPLVGMRASTIKDTTITVFGNCGHCKKSIEKASYSIGGVQSAIWDKTKKKLNLRFDSTKTSLLLIEQSIISVGYDTENMRTQDSVYQSLSPCCKYERKSK